MANGEGLTVLEKKTLAGLSMIFAIRMFGLFIVLPVISLYARTLPGANPLWLGLALGGYGLSQAIFQIPFGMLSDRFGRKPIIVIGLLIFAAGSIFAASAHSVLSLFIGRLLQGSGAIAAVVIALMADLTREEYRTRAMAGIGISIGLSFAVGMVVGPILGARYGVASLFWLTTVLSLVGIAILLLVVPNPEGAVHKNEMELSVSQLAYVLKNPALARIDLSVFLLHLFLTAVFVSFPVLLHQYMPAESMWKVYLPVILGGMFLMVPGMIIAEKKKKLKIAFMIAILFIVASFVIFLLGYRSEFGLIAGLSVFFVGFNLLEPLMPSIMTRFVRTRTRGTSSGVFSMSQFLGAFVGGALGGALVSISNEALFIGMLILSVIWIFAALGLTDPNLLETFELPVTRELSDPLPLVRQMGDMAGVVDCRYRESERILWIKYLKDRITPEDLERKLTGLLEV
ncbi:MAG: MFS transporter [Nitrospirota bacterium]|nr:MFS transporter [Nitrospirota bacterium]